MLLSVHAIWGSASAPTAEHQRRRPRTAGDRAGTQNRQFISALVERFRHFSDPFLHLVAHLACASGSIVLLADSASELGEFAGHRDTIAYPATPNTTGSIASIPSVAFSIFRSFPRVLTGAVSGLASAVARVRT
jgi:hypothetical protein